MGQYIIDTNVFSNFLNNSFNKNGMDFMSNIIDNSPKISFITQIELLCWQSNFEKQYWINQFIENCEILNISDDIIKKCVEIRKSKKSKLPDAIIAATALVYEYEVITNNTKDFLNIKNLKIINPYNL